MMNKLLVLFLLFMIYAFLGWIMEVIVTLIDEKKFVNRGFLIGPYCPIYGRGVILILFLIGSNSQDILSVFLKSILICAVLEYVTSYLMEKVFKARWWDYSNKKFNINGRICLENLIPFGILGTLCYYVLNPFFIKLINLMNAKVRLILGISLLVIYLTDNVISYTIMNKIKGNINLQKKDNTDEIKVNVLKWLEKNSVLYRHIKNAYPNFVIKRKNKDGKTMPARLIIVLSFLLAIISLDTFQAKVFNNSPVMKTVENYKEGNLLRKEKGILVDTYVFKDGQKVTVFKWSKYSLPKEEENKMENIKVIINDKKYNVVLEDNETTKAFISKLDNEYVMKELNGNEKYVYMDYSLPTNSTNPKHIEKGDIMLYGDNCLVIFYKSFATSYSYTKIGHIDNLDLNDAGDITVKFTK